MSSDAPTIDIEQLNDSTELVQPVKKAKARHSSWLVTINTNFAVRTGDEPELPEMKQRLTNAYNALFEGDNILDLIEYRDESTAGSEFIDDISVTGTIEIGPVKRLLHLHAILSIKHRSKIRMRYGKITRIVHEKSPGAYCNLKPFNNSYAYMLDYISKNKEMLKRDM